MKKLGCMVIALLVASLSACSTRYSSNGETLYLQSPNGEKVVVPPPLTRANISGYYDLPAQNQASRVSILPPVGEDLT